LQVARRSHISVRLQDGRIFVAGGIGICNSQICTTLASAEIYDPQSGTWSTVASMPAPRFGHVAVTLNDGRVLVNGGCQGTGLPCAAQGAVLYDPATNQWTNTGPVVVAALAGHGDAAAFGRRHRRGRPEQPGLRRVHDRILRSCPEHMVRAGRAHREPLHRQRDAAADGADPVRGRQLGIGGAL
jgi:hypothetical protein